MFFLLLTDLTCLLLDYYFLSEKYLFELQEVSIKNVLRDFLTSLGKQGREERLLILCNAPRTFISSTALSIVIMPHYDMKCGDSRKWHFSLV